MLPWGAATDEHTALDRYRSMVTAWQPGDRWALPCGRGASEVAHETVSDLLNGRDDEPKAMTAKPAIKPPRQAATAMENERGFGGYSV